MLWRAGSHIAADVTELFSTTTIRRCVLQISSEWACAKPMHLGPAMDSGGDSLTAASAVQRRTAGRRRGG